MDKAATVKDWSIEAITTDKTLNVLTVQSFLNKDCDCNPKKEENQDYIKALESKELSEFFMRRLRGEVKVDRDANLSELTKMERLKLKLQVDEKFDKFFSEYKALFAIYVKKLYLVQTSERIRNLILEKDKAKNSGYKLVSDEFVRQTNPVVPTTSLKATIKDRTKTEEVITPVVETTEENAYSVYRLGHVSKSDKVEVKKTAPIRARIK